MKSSRAFSLLEMMAVTAVIAILSSLLLPTLARSRSHARRVQCLSNLRQLGIASRLYWDDNGGAAFRYFHGEKNGGMLYWFGWLQAGAEGERKFDPSQGVLYPYYSMHQTGLCPSLNPFLPGFKRKASGSSFGYGYNLSLSSEAGQPALLVDVLRRPAGVVLFADSAQVNTFQPPASPENPMLEEFYYVNNTEPTAHFRHAARAGAVFCDGHAGGETAVAGSLDPRLPSAFVGRLSDDVILVR